MQVTKQELKTAFSNGQLPDGGDFANLIDFFVPEERFDAHVREFDAFKKRPDVTLGPARDGWTLWLDETDSHVWLAPGDKRPSQPVGTAAQGAASTDPVSMPDTGGIPDVVSADVNLWGWTAAAGRVGTFWGRDALAGTTSELADRMPTREALKSDGKSHVLFDTPERPCVLEIVAATNADPPQERKRGARMARMVGFGAPSNAAIHAIVAANGDSGRPTIRYTNAPNSHLGWKTACLIVLLAAAVLIMLGKYLITPSQIESLLGAFSALGARFENLLEWVTNLFSGGADPVAQTTTNVDPNAAGPAGSPAGGAGAAASEADSKMSVGDWLVVCIAAAMILGAATFINRCRHRAAAAITLDWVRSSGGILHGDAKYRLEIRGPDLSQARGDRNLHVHVTKHWA